MTIPQYVVGLVFTADRKNVLLIEKRRPAWQAGKLNGIGGHIEANETPLDAMIRECREETSLCIDDWQPVAKLIGRDFEVHFFTVFTDMARCYVRRTDENLFLPPVTPLHGNVVANLRVMIPLALDTSGIVKPVHFMDGVPAAESLG